VFNQNAEKTKKGYSVRRLLLYEFPRKKLVSSFCKMPGLFQLTLAAFENYWRSAAWFKI